MADSFSVSAYLGSLAKRVNEGAMIAGKWVLKTAFIGAAALGVMSLFHPVTAGLVAATFVGATVGMGILTAKEALGMHTAPDPAVLDMPWNLQSGKAVPSVEPQMEQEVPNPGKHWQHSVKRPPDKDQGRGR